MVTQGSSMQKAEQPLSNLPPQQQQQQQQQQQEVSTPQQKQEDQGGSSLEAILSAVLKEPLTQDARDLMNTIVQQQPQSMQQQLLQLFVENENRRISSENDRLHQQYSVQSSHASSGSGSSQLIELQNMESQNTTQQGEQNTNDSFQRLPTHNDDDNNSINTGYSLRTTTLDTIRGLLSDPDPAQNILKLTYVILMSTSLILIIIFITISQLNQTTEDNKESPIHSYVKKYSISLCFVGPFAASLYHLHVRRYVFHWCLPFWLVVFYAIAASLYDTLSLNGYL